MPQSDESHYEVLGVSINASPEEISDKVAKLRNLYSKRPYELVQRYDLDKYFTQSVAEELAALREYRLNEQAYLAHGAPSYDTKKQTFVELLKTRKEQIDAAALVLLDPVKRAEYQKEQLAIAKREADLKADVVAEFWDVSTPENIGRSFAVLQKQLNLLSVARDAGQLMEELKGIVSSVLQTNTNSVSAEEQNKVIARLEYWKSEIEKSKPDYLPHQYPEYLDKLINLCQALQQRYLALTSKVAVAPASSAPAPSVPSVPQVPPEPTQIARVLAVPQLQKKLDPDVALEIPAVLCRKEKYTGTGERHQAKYAFLQAVEDELKINILPRQAVRNAFISVGPEKAMKALEGTFRSHRVYDYVESVLGVQEAKLYALHARLKSQIKNMPEGAEKEVKNAKIKFLDAVIGEIQKGSSVKQAAQAVVNSQDHNLQQVTKGAFSKVEKWLNEVKAIKEVVPEVDTRSSPAPGRCP